MLSDSSHILYEDEVRDIKEMDKVRRWERTIFMLLLQMGMLFALYVFLSLIGLIIGMLLLFFIFPPPFITIPSRYKVTKEGIFMDKGTMGLAKGIGLRFKVHKEKSCVAVYRKNREIMWIYAHDLDGLMRALNEALSSTGDKAR